MKYYLYILETTDNTLYCGIAKDVFKRFDEHKNSKKGAKYTKIHPPKKLVYIDEFEDKSAALKEEYRIKKTLSKKEKLLLIQENKIRTEKFLKEFSSCQQPA